MQPAAPMRVWYPTQEPLCALGGFRTTSQCGTNVSNLLRYRLFPTELGRALQPSHVASVSFSGLLAARVKILQLLSRL